MRLKVLHASRTPSQSARVLRSNIPDRVHIGNLIAGVARIAEHHGNACLDSRSGSADLDPGSEFGDAARRIVGLKSEFGGWMKHAWSAEAIRGHGRLAAIAMFYRFHRRFCAHHGYIG